MLHSGLSGNFLYIFFKNSDFIPKFGPNSDHFGGLVRIRTQVRNSDLIGQAAYLLKKYNLFAAFICDLLPLCLRLGIPKLSSECLLPPGALSLSFTLFLVLSFFMLYFSPASFPSFSFPPLSSDTALLPTLSLLLL